MHSNATRLAEFLYGSLYEYDYICFICQTTFTVLRCTAVQFLIDKRVVRDALNTSLNPNWSAMHRVSLRTCCFQDFYHFGVACTAVCQSGWTGNRSSGWQGLTGTYWSLIGHGESRDQCSGPADRCTAEERNRESLTRSSACEKLRSTLLRVSRLTRNLAAAWWLFWELRVTTWCARTTWFTAMEVFRYRSMATSSVKPNSCTTTFSSASRRRDRGAVIRYLREKAEPRICDSTGSHSNL